MTKLKYTAILMLIAWNFASCQMTGTTDQPGKLKRDTAITSSNSFSTLFFDSLAMEDYLQGLAVRDTAKALFRNFYNHRNFQFAWFDSAGVAEQAGSFWNLQDNYIGYSGDSSIFNPFLQRWADSVTQNGLHAVPDSLRQKVEWELTFQFFRYASRAYMGDRRLRARELQWFIPRKRVDILSLLDTLIKEKGKEVGRFEPVNPQYALLRDQLQRYHSIEQQDAWDSLPITAKKLRQGDAAEIIIKIKKRLFLAGDLEVNDSTGLFTPELEKAVINFQQRYGLKDDGVIGGATLREMSRPVSHRIRQLLVNMERLRWVPAAPEGDYLLVNIPEFRLHVYEKGQYDFNMNVVVGTQTNNTVIFTGKLETVVFSPYWNVPPGILKNEVLPAIKRDPSYLERHNMEWNGGRVRQRPGPNNSLGQVKFLFPNNYNIYLHDTPSKSLFGESKRAFSHGCIRVAEPQKLAQWILRYDSSWTEKKIKEAMLSGKERYVPVKTDLPVFIGYFTAFVDRKGRLNFREDIYGHDRRMSEKMFGK